MQRGFKVKKDLRYGSSTLEVQCSCCQQGRRTNNKDIYPEWANARNHEVYKILWVRWAKQSIVEQPHRQWQRKQIGCLGSCDKHCGRDEQVRRNVEIDPGLYCYSLHPITERAIQKVETVKRRAAWQVPIHHRNTSNVGNMLEELRLHTLEKRKQK